MHSVPAADWTEMGWRRCRTRWNNPTVADHQAPDFAVKPTLTGERVVLRPFRLDADADALREMLCDPEAFKLAGSGNSAAAMRDWDAAAEAGFRDWYGSRNEQSDRLDLAVVDKASARCVGEVALNQFDLSNRSCNFRVLFGPGGRDRGLGTESTRLIVGYGFERLGLHRISLEVYAFNPRARRVYDKVGFVAEGVLRDALRWDDQWVDATVMSILAPEWNRHHGRP
jgi:RimJ/RimL family protein N-acetyltransferase